MNKLQLRDVVKKIKLRGYWKVVFEPTSPKLNFFDHISDADKLVEANSIELRGWDYPHYTGTEKDHQRLEIQNDRVNGFVDWNHFIEAWSFYESGQFVHIFGLREDWYKESGWLAGDRLSQIEPLKYLDFVGVTLTITEIFIFAKNLINNSSYGDSMRISISLLNAEGRTLTTFDPRRVPLFSNYQTSAKEINAFDKLVNKTELNEHYLDLGQDAIIRLLRYFKGFNPPIKVIQEDQVKLIERRL